MSKVMTIVMTPTKLSKSESTAKEQKNDLYLDPDVELQSGTPFIYRLRGYYDGNASGMSSSVPVYTGYNVISLDSLITAITQKTWSMIPQKNLVITFDDGWKGNYNLLGVIKEFNIPVTIYLSSRIINTNRRFWWHAGFSDIQKLKQLSNQERLFILKENNGYEQGKEYTEPQSLNFQEIKKWH